MPARGQERRRGGRRSGCSRERRDRCGSVVGSRSVHRWGVLDPWPGYKRLRDAGPAVWRPSTRCSPSPRTTRCGVCCGGLARHRVLRGRQPRRAQVSRPGSVRCAAKSPVAQVGQMCKAAHPSAAPAMIRRGAAASAGGDL